MAALGCVLLLVLPLLGVIAGGWLAGASGAVVGGAIGLVLALGACGVAAAGLWQAGRRR